MVQESGSDPVEVVRPVLVSLAGRAAACVAEPLVKGTRKRLEWIPGSSHQQGQQDSVPHDLPPSGPTGQSHEELDNFLDNLFHPVFRADDFARPIDRG